MKYLPFKFLVTFFFLLIITVSIHGTDRIAETEPNNKFKEAQPITIPCIIDGHFASLPNPDLYSFSIPTGGMDSLLAILNPPTDVDAMLTLLDSDGKILTESNFFKKGKTEYLTTLLLPPGKYYLKVYRMGGKLSDSAAYELSVGSTPPVQADDIHQALNRALDYLVKHQTDDGGFNSRTGKVAIAGLAIQALLGAENLQRNDWNTIYKAIDYLESFYHSPKEYSKGTLFTEKRKGAIFSSHVLYEHAIAITALIEANSAGVKGKLPEMIREGIAFIQHAQVSENRPAILNGPFAKDHRHYGGWKYEADAKNADLSVSGWQIIALIAGKRAGFEVSAGTLDRARTFVEHCYDSKKKQFAYFPKGQVSTGRCAMGALSMQLLDKKDDPRIKQAIRMILTRPPTWEGEPLHGGYPFYYAYYGTRAAYIDGGKTWSVWKQAVCGMLVRHQNKTGSWELNAKEDNRGLDSIYSTALGALSLEICSGIPPIYLQHGVAPARPTPPPRDEIRVSIEQPAANSMIQGEVEIKVVPVVPERGTVSKVTFRVDGKDIGTLEAPPWNMQTNIGPGVKSHTFEVIAENSFGTAAKATVKTKKGQNRISIKILEPRRNAVNPQNGIHVEASAHKDSPLTQVVVMVDGKEVYNGIKSLNIIPYSFSPGEHVIVAKAVNCFGKEAQTQIKIKGAKPLEVTLTAVVINAKNEHVLDLKKKDFQIKEDGVAQKISRFGLELTPVSMALLIDTSGSIRRAMRQVQNAATRFVSQIRKEDRAAVIRFSSKPQTMQAFTSNRKALTRAIKSTRAKGGTALYDSIWMALEQLKSEKGRASIILLTDGKDENTRGNGPGSQHRFDETVDAAKKAGVTIYALGMGKGVARDVLINLAKPTGGKAYFPPTPRDLTEVYRKISRDIRSQYTLGYSSTNTSRDGSLRKVTVEVPGREVTIRTQEGYVAK